MSKSPRALQELMTAVDAGHAVDVDVDSSASSDRSKLLGPRRRRSTHYSRAGGGGAPKRAPAVAVQVEASADASFEFSTAVNSYSSASPASMVFSDGQLRAHQFPAVPARSCASADSSQSTSPLRSSSYGSSSYGGSTATRQQAGALTGSKKRVSFATDGADRAAAAAAQAGGGGHGKKSGGLLGCCGPSSRDEAVQPVARNVNRKVVAF